MGEVLLFNLEPQKAIAVKNLCRKLYLEYREVAPEDHGRKLGFLLGVIDDDTAEADARFEEEMLYFSDISSGMLDIILAQLRRRKCTVALKAVRTETNVQFTACELCRELSAERAAIARGQQAHQP